MRVCLTGGSGLLGGAIKDACSQRNWFCQSLSRDVVDFRYPRKVERYLSNCDVLVHAAANTNVEGCEADPDMCYRDNTLLTDVLATAARNCGVKFVFISSTGVYGDYQRHPYTDYDSASPTTHHHKAKYLGEAVALKSSESLVIRTGWLFGGGHQNKKNFVARRIEEAVLSAGVVHSNDEQRGNPTYVRDVAHYLCQLIEEGQFGLFNCVNEGDASRKEYVEKILEFAGVEVEVRAAPASSFKRLAKVSNNEMAMNLKLRQCGYEALPTWEDSLGRYIKEELAEFCNKAKNN